jgi:hypothetical protein
MRVVDTKNVRLYAFRSGTRRANGNRRPHTGIEVRLRRGRRWLCGALTFRWIDTGRGRGKFWIEAQLYRRCPRQATGSWRRDQRDPDFLKRYVRLIVGLGGDGRHLP